jgi:hypothetical protein
MQYTVVQRAVSGIYTVVQYCKNYFSNPQTSTEGTTVKNTLQVRKERGVRRREGMSRKGYCIHTIERVIFLEGVVQCKVYRVALILYGQSYEVQ